MSAIPIHQNTKEDKINTRFNCKNCSFESPKLFDVREIMKRGISLSWVVGASEKRIYLCALYHCEKCNGVSKYKID